MKSGFLFFYLMLIADGEHRVVEWLRHYATSWKVTRSRPDKVNEVFFNLPNPSGRTRLRSLLSV
jgi:hypothetical protein